MTSTMIPRLQHVHIAVSDVHGAFELERRLEHLNPTAVCVDGVWSIELFDDQDRGEEIDAVIRHWLLDAHRTSVFVSVDGQVHDVFVR